MDKKKMVPELAKKGVEELRTQVKDLRNKLKEK